MGLCDEGEVRIVFSDSSETQRRVIFQASTERLRVRHATGSVESDPRQYMILPMSRDKLMEDDKLILEFMPVTTTNVDADAAGCTIEIPVTMRNIRTGNIFEKTIRLLDVMATGDDVATAADVWTSFASYTIGAQEALRLGWELAENSRVLIQLEE